MSNLQQLPTVYVIAQHPENRSCYLNLTKWHVISRSGVAKAVAVVMSNAVVHSRRRTRLLQGLEVICGHALQLISGSRMVLTFSGTKCLNKIQLLKVCKGCMLR